MSAHLLPDHTVVVNNFAEFRDDIQAFADGNYNFAIVVGTTGLGKTETVREMLGDSCLVVAGCPTAWKLYQMLHDHRDFVVLDDVGTQFYRNDTCLSYLKQLTETRPKKVLRWPTTSPGKGNRYPNEFATTSRVIILTNQWKSLNEHLRAVEGRAFVMKFDPTPAEVHHQVARGGWFQDQEVFDFVWEHRRFITRPDMRLYVKISEQRQAGRPWRKRGLEMLIGSDSRLNQLAEILLDPKYTSNQQRWKAFQDRGYGGRTLFYELFREFRFYKVTAPNAPPPQLSRPVVVDRQPPFLGNGNLFGLN